MEVGSQNQSQFTDDDDCSEEKKISRMRVFVEGQDPDAKELDDLMFRRFLRSRDQDIEKACSQLLKYLKWRRTAVPNGFISETEIKNQLSDRKVYMQGFDKSGRPILVAFGAKHSPSKRDMDEFKSFVVYSLDKLCSGIPSNQEKFTCIWDLKGWGYSNCDIRGYIAALEIMQNYYPERLGKVYVIHVPYIFMKAWKMIYPFIDKNTREKFEFVEDKDLKVTLLTNIDESQLPENYGGNMQLVPIEEATI